VEEGSRSLGEARSASLRQLQVLESSNSREQAAAGA
jgi:hypothetical protein